MFSVSVEKIGRSTVNRLVTWWWCWLCGCVGSRWSSLPGRPAAGPGTWSGCWRSVAWNFILYLDDNQDQSEDVHGLWRNSSHWGDDVTSVCLSFLCESVDLLLITDWLIVQFSSVQSEGGVTWAAAPPSSSRPVRGRTWTLMELKSLRWWWHWGLSVVSLWSHW